MIETHVNPASHVVDVPAGRRFDVKEEDLLKGLQTLLVPGV